MSYASSNMKLNELYYCIQQANNRFKQCCISAMFIIVFIPIITTLSVSGVFLTQCTRQKVFLSSAIYEEMVKSTEVSVATDGASCIFSCYSLRDEILSVLYNDVIKLCSCLTIPAGCVPLRTVGVEVYLVAIRGKKCKEKNISLMPNDMY